MYVNTQQRWHHYRIFERCHQGVARGMDARGMDGGRFKRKLSEINTRAVSGGQNELVGKFKMVAGDMVSIRRQVMEYTYIPDRKSVV